jgi:hypothetical protein
MNKIKVDLDVIEDLFQEPEFNPFDPDCRCESGVADLFNQTQNLSPKEPVQIEISLATQPEGTDTLGKTEAALRRYCEVKIVQSEREIREIRHQGKRDLGCYYFGDPVVRCLLGHPADLPARDHHLPFVYRSRNHCLGSPLAPIGQHSL